MSKKTNAMEQMIRYGERNIRNSFKDDGDIEEILRISNNLQTIPRYDRFLRSPMGASLTEGEVEIMSQRAPSAERGAREAMRLKKQKL